MNSALVHYSLWKSQQMQAKKKYEREKRQKWKRRRTNAETKLVHNVVDGSLIQTKNKNEILFNFFFFLNLHS